jgi:N6-adenosine-specific RNA methylase IME4
LRGAGNVKKYQIIYADPPWHYRNYADKTASRWVGNKYPVMSVDDICSLPISKIADKDCALFLWTTPPCLQEALKVINSWGFEYKTKAFSWVKTNRISDSLFWGMGYWTRSNTEDCWLAVRGNPKRKNAGVHQVVMSPVMKHSEKPAEFRDRIVKLCGDLPRIELFARQKVDGWDCWGNEVDSDIEL